MPIRGVTPAEGAEGAAEQPGLNLTGMTVELVFFRHRCPGDNGRQPVIRQVRFAALPEAILSK